MLLNEYTMSMGAILKHLATVEDWSISDLFISICVHEGLQDPINRIRLLYGKTRNKAIMKF